MKRVLLLAFLLVCTPSAYAQRNNSKASQSNNSASQAQRQAESLSKQPELPVNVRLRFQVLQNLLPGITSKGDSSKTLVFFSTTRVLFWNRPVSPPVAQAMRDFEGQVVALAKAKNFNLDLPPVGYSMVGAQIAAGPAEQGNNGGGSLLVNRATIEGLREVTLRAEEMGTAALSRTPSPQLQALRDSLTVLRQDLADPEVSTDAVRNVLQSRVVFLASPAAAGIDPQFLQRLDYAAEVLRTNFPPELLRQAKGQVIPI